MYIVNRKYYYSSLEQALECAKQILRKRAYVPINEQFKITQGKNKGYCVALCDNWEKVGNENLLRVIIQTVEIDKKFS